MQHEHIQENNLAGTLLQHPPAQAVELLAKRNWFRLHGRNLLRNVLGVHGMRRLNVEAALAAVLIALLFITLGVNP